MKPKTAKWLKTQYATIGASSAPTVLGKNPFQTRAELAALMREEVPYPDLSGNDDVLRGYYLEPVARSILSTTLGQQCFKHDQSDFRRNPKYPWAHCLVDAWMGLNRAMPVEIKWPRGPKFSRILMFGTPVEYWMQCQHQIAVIGCQRSVLAVLCADRLSTPIIQTIERDQKFIDELMAKEEEFYRDVKSGHVFDDDEKTSELVIPAFEGETKVLFLNQTAARMAREYLDAQQLVTDAEGIKADAKSRLLMELGDSTECWDVRDGDEEIVRVRRFPGRTTETIDKAGARAAYPDFDRFVKTKRGDPFWTIYELKRNRGGW